MELSKKDAYLLWERKLLSLTLASLCHKCFTSPPALPLLYTSLCTVSIYGCFIEIHGTRKTDRGSHEAGEPPLMDMGYNIIKYI